MKKCFKCGIEKPLVDFYKHKKMADGFLNKCKDCTKKDVRNIYDTNRDDPEFIEAERERGRAKYYRLYKGLPSNQEVRRKSSVKYRQNYPEKLSATNATQNLNRKSGFNLHHWSYNEEHYKDIIEINEQDHYLAHRNMIYDQEFYMYRKLSGELLDSKELHIKHLQSIGIKL